MRKYAFNGLSLMMRVDSKRGLELAHGYAVFNQQKYSVWLHFQAMPPFKYTIMRTAAQGSGAMGTPVYFANSWPQAQDKLKQAGFTDAAIAEIDGELQKSGAASHGPVEMTVEQGMVLGLRLS